MVTDERVWSDPAVARYFEGIRQNAQVRQNQDDGRPFLQFDYERGAEYALRGMPYIAHSRTGEIVNMTTGQVVMK